VGFLIFQLILMGIFGTTAAAIASIKGRSLIGWFFFAGIFGMIPFFGLLLGLIPIIMLFVIPNLKDERAHRDHSIRENRRLREQLYQERVKNESFRRHTMGRIDSHDRHLGINTRNTQAALPMKDSGQFLDNHDWDESESQKLLPAEVLSDSSTNQPSNREWHYVVDGKSKGPISESQLLSMMRSGKLDGSTLLWTEKLNDWKAADQIRGLQRFLKS